LPGWGTLGTVHIGTRAGALVRNNHTGVYCQANAGVLRALNQRAVEVALEA